MIGCLSIGMALLGAGCAAPSCRNGAASRAACPIETVGTPAAPDDLVVSKPNVQTVSTYQELASQLAHDESQLQHLVIDAHECQCGAARHASIANALAQEAVAQQAAADHPATVCASMTCRSLLQCAEIADRNRAAAAALEAFYRLAEARALVLDLDRGLQQLADTQRQLRSLRERDIAVTVDESQLIRQQLEMRDQRVQAKLAIGQLESQLRQLLPLGPACDAHIWVHADLTVEVIPLDLDAAIADGLAHRADLAALRILCTCRHSQSLPVVRQGLQQVNGLLGSRCGETPSLIAFLKLCDKCAQECESQLRQSQVCQLAEQRQVQIVEEIRQAVATVDARLLQVALAKEKLTSWRKRVDELRRLSEVQKATQLEVRAARLERLRAEGELTRQVVAWKLAHVKLAESQGLLAVECGSQLPSCDPGPSGPAFAQLDSGAHTPTTDPPVEPVRLTRLPQTAIDPAVVAVSAETELPTAAPAGP